MNNIEISFNLPVIDGTTRTITSFWRFSWTGKQRLINMYKINKDKKCDIHIIQIINKRLKWFKKKKAY